MRAAGRLTVAVPDIPYYVAMLRELVPNAEILTFDDVNALLADRTATVDAVAFPAERGSAWTLIHPRYSVVVPGPLRIRLPLAYPMARDDQAFARFVNTWIALKQKDGTLETLYDYWILGRSADAASPRWSLIRDVLHWVN